MKTSMAKQNPDTVVTLAVSRAEIIAMLDAIAASGIDSEDTQSARKKLSRILRPVSNLPSEQPSAHC